MNFLSGIFDKHDTKKLESLFIKLSGPLNVQISSETIETPFSLSSQLSIAICTDFGYIDWCSAWYY